MIVALVLYPETVRFAVSMIPMKIGIYLALLDKRHAVAAVVVVAHSNHGQNHLATHFHLMIVRIPHYVANRTFVIHDYTSIRPYNFLTAHRQTRTHNTANNRTDVDNNQTLRDTQMRRTLLTLLDSRPTNVLLSTVA